MSWRPIESAPRDGTEFLAYRKDAGPLLVRWGAVSDIFTSIEIELQFSGWSDDELDAAGWMVADFVSGSRLDDDDPPTHWMPLPAAPTDTRADNSPASQGAGLSRQGE